MQMKILHLFSEQAWAADCSYPIFRSLYFWSMHNDRPFDHGCETCNCARRHRHHARFVPRTIRTNEIIHARSDLFNSGVFRLVLRGRYLEPLLIIAQTGYPYQKPFQMERQDVVTIQASILSLKGAPSRLGSFRQICAKLH